MDIDKTIRKLRWNQSLNTRGYNKNIDKTIQTVLYGYAKYCENILRADCKKLQKQKFATMEDWTKAVQEHTKARNAYKLLLQIAENPKQYLYKDVNMIYIEMPNKQSLYENLSPIMTNRFDPSGNHLLVRLSEAITKHVNRGIYNETERKTGVWAFYPGGAFCDSEAEEIIKINFAVEKMNTNQYIAAFKDMFIPASCYAVDLHRVR